MCRLKHTRDQLVRHSIDVLLPSLTVSVRSIRMRREVPQFAAAEGGMRHELCSAAAVDALAAVEQQRGQVEEVGEGQHASEASGGTVQKQEDYVGSIVEVAYDAVVAAGEQQVAVHSAGGVTIWRWNDARRTAPDGALAVGGAHAVALGV